MSKHRKSLFLATTSLLVLAYASTASATHVSNNFTGWVGHDQKAFYLNPSSWASCNTGEICGTIEATVGTSQCREQSFSVGASFEPPIPQTWGVFSLGGSGGMAWSTCHERSETFTCTSSHGIQVRGVEHLQERVGTIKLTGGTPNEVRVRADQACPAHWQFTQYIGTRGGNQKQCIYNNHGDTVTGYLPEFQRLKCDWQWLPGHPKPGEKPPA